MSDDDLRRLAELAADHDERLRREHPEWARQLLAVCLAQGAARHRVHGDRGVKDFDVWLFYVLPAGRHGGHFPWNRYTGAVDFGPSAHGRQKYTAEERANSSFDVPKWNTFTGRRVDLLARAIAAHRDGPRAAVRAWLQRAERYRPRPGRRHPSWWWLAQAPVIALADPSLGEQWWDPGGADPAPRPLPS